MRWRLCSSMLLALAPARLYCQMSYCSIPRPRISMRELSTAPSMWCLSRRHCLYVRLSFRYLSLAQLKTGAGKNSINPVRGRVSYQEAMLAAVSEENRKGREGAREPRSLPSLAAITKAAIRARSIPPSGCRFISPVTFALRSFSLSVALIASRALALPSSSNFRNFPAPGQTKTALGTTERAFFVWLDKSLPLHITSTTVPEYVSASAAIEKRKSKSAENDTFHGCCLL